MHAESNAMYQFWHYNYYKKKKKEDKMNHIFSNTPIQ